MGPRSPAETHERWTQAFRAKDVDALVELYEPDAVFVPEPGQEVQGRQAIREVLTGFLGVGGEFDMHSTRAIGAADPAIVYSKWRLSGGRDAEGNAVDLDGETTDVVRRQPDGS